MWEVLYLSCSKYFLKHSSTRWTILTTFKINFYKSEFRYLLPSIKRWDMFDGKLRSLFRQLCSLYVSCLLKIHKSFISKYCNINFQSVLWCRNWTNSQFTLSWDFLSLSNNLFCWLSCSAEQHQHQHVMWTKFEIYFRQNKSLSENKAHPLNLRGCEDWSRVALAYV